MRGGKITTLCKRGIDEDEGHNRLTSSSENRRFCLGSDLSRGYVMTVDTLNPDNSNGGAALEATNIETDYHRPDCPNGEV